MFCSKCGQEYTGSPAYCQNCGAPVADAVKYAGFWRRLAACIIDTILLGLVGSIIGFFISSEDTSGVIALNLISTVVSWLYYALMESSSNQATLGKMALGIIVTDGAGNRISFLRATGRNFAKYISGAILFIGYIMIAFTKKKQGLHDMICDTLVVTGKRA